MLKDLVEPTIVKQIQDRELTNEVKRIVGLTQNRVSELEHIIYKSNERHSIFDDLYKRLNTVVRTTLTVSIRNYKVLQEAEKKTLEERLNEEVFRIGKKHEIVDNRLEIIESEHITLVYII